MKKTRVRVISLILSMMFIFSLMLAPVYAVESSVTREDVYNAAQKTIKYYHETFKPKEFEGILDWPALGLFAFGEDVSGDKWTVNGKNGAYWREQEVEEGIRLYTAKNTDYQRTIIGVCAAGKDPRNFGGKNLVEIEKSTMMKNGHFADSVADNTTGEPVGEELINAHIFGIIAMHVAGEPIPNRDKAVEWLENNANLDGGYTWNINYFDDPEDYKLVESGVDMTAAAIMGFAILGEDESNPHVADALEFLHERQMDNGGFCSWGTENPESCDWVIQALTLLGQDPMGPDWTKPSGGNPVSQVLRFQLENGSFTHILEEENAFPVYDNGMSTEQSLYGLADAYNKKAAYDILYEKYRPEAEKHLFKDFKPGDYAFDESMDLVYDYVISGYSDRTFRPERLLTRAEMATILVRALDLDKKVTAENVKSFDDVPNEHWTKENIDLCKAAGIINGISETLFAPDKNITGAEFMTILTKATGLEEEANKIEDEGKHWAYKYIKTAESNGLLYSGFDEDKNVSRVQCAWSIGRLRDLGNY